MDIKNVRVLRLFKINGIVLWPFVFYADKDPHPIVKNHEAIHLDQIRRTGILKFYALYLMEYGKGRLSGLSHDEAYMNISFEKEAYAKQSDFNFLAARTSPTNSRSRGQS